MLQKWVPWVGVLSNCSYWVDGAAYREGFSICYYSLWRPTLESNQFVKMFGYRLNRCKNQRLGIGLTSSAWPVYVFFPHAPVHKRLLLSDDQQKFWLDRIVFPSVKEVYDVGHTHHHPSSFAEIRDKARAKQLESTSEIHKRPMELFYELPDVDFEGQPGQLAKLWDAMQQRMRQEGTEWLQDAFLVTIRFDCKQVLRRKFVADLKMALDESIDRELHRDFINLRDAWVDIGCEEFTQSPGIVLLRKSLCNKADARVLGIRKPLEYTWQGTADAGTIWGGVGVRSVQYTGGLAKFQAYNVIRHLFGIIDRSFPAAFRDPNLEALGLTQKLMEKYLNANQDGSGWRANRERILTAYAATKSRVRNALIAATGKSYGVRKEWRVTWWQWSVFDREQAHHT